jgi:hypothetical protein
MLKQIMSYAMAMASRGLNNQKIDLFTKQLRYISCYGDGTIPPCSFLKKSDKSNFFYCGKCGCGDNPGTWLVKNAEEYSKLDYPILECPVKMPGFTNYDPNFYDSNDNQRKKLIESMDPSKVQLVQITVNQSQKHDELLEKLNNIKKNS